MWRHRPESDPASALSRRGFLKVAGGAGMGLVIGYALPGGGADALAAAGESALNPFVRIGPDGTVTVLIKHLDKGQGAATGLATLVAEELDADWAQMRPEFAPANAKLYANILFGEVQGTGGSTSIANSWEQYRKAGAAARAMLVEAAARGWRVPAREIAVAKGVVSHPSGRSARFGELADKAAALPPPADIRLKDAKDYVLIGQRLPRLDSASKTDGTAIFTQDFKRPGMLVAVVAHPPRFGGKVRSFDAAAAKAVPGVVEVVAVPQGVAVLARSTWPAIRGRDALKVEWDDAQAEMRGSAEILRDYKALAQRPGLSARKDGDADAALARAAKVVEAEFEFPYLAHAAMEPMNACVELSSDKCEIWTGSQLPTVDQAVAAGIAELKPDQVVINTLWAGGSFGRRAVPDSDYVAEAVAVAKAIDGRAPVKLVWTREDDTRGGRYRPMFYHKVRAGLDDKGDIVGWKHQIVGQSFIKGTPFEAVIVKDGIDGTAVEGVADTKYKIPNISVEQHLAETRVPTLWWRSVGHTHTAHVMESMIDALAHEAGKDPVAFRMALLEDHPRHRAVLRLAAEKAGWGTPLAKGKGRGVAVHESFSSYVAQVAEVTMRADGSFKVDRVVAAVDVGTPVNPDVIRAQVEGGVGFGLGAALRNAITLTGGVVDQGNFDSYEPLRIDDMPAVEVHIAPSSEPPTGIGEPGVPPVAPAVANAVFAASGRRMWSLPFSRHAAGA